MMGAVPRPAVPIYPGPEVVRRLYVDEQKSLRDIALIYGVTKPTVSTWLKKSGVQSRSIREATILSGKYGVHSEAHSDSLRKNIAIARSHITAESHVKRGAALKGKTPHNKGARWTPEERATHMAVRKTDAYRANLSASLSGEKNHMWKGGVTTRSPSGWKWRDVRSAVYERDNWTCQDCGCKCVNGIDAKKHPKRKIQCHHVISRRLGGLDTMDNLVTLCMSCHHKRERRYADALIA